MTNKKGYSKHSLNQNNKMKLVTDWQFKEGVFKLPSGKWICRIKYKDKNLYRWSTLSQHNAESEAQQAYDDYTKNN